MGRLWRRLALATKAAAGTPVAGARPGCAALHRAARCALEEAQEPSWGTARGSCCTLSLQVGIVSGTCIGIAVGAEEGER